MNCQPRFSVVTTTAIAAAVLLLSSPARADSIQINAPSLVDPDMTWAIHEVKGTSVSAQLISGDGIDAAALDPLNLTVGNLTVGAGPVGVAGGLFFNYLRYDDNGDNLHISAVDFYGDPGLVYDGTTRYRTDVTVGGLLESRILVGPFPGDTSQVELDYFFQSNPGQACYNNPFTCSHPSGTGDGVGTGNALIPDVLGSSFLAAEIHWSDDSGVERAVDTFDFDITDSAVPEPTSLLLLGSGLAVVGSRLRRRKTNA